MPATKRFVQPSRGSLLFHGHAPIGFGGAHQLLEGLFALLDLLLQHREVVLQRGVVMVLTHFLEQHAHGRQRSAQFVGSACGLVATASNC